MNRSSNSACLVEIHDNAYLAPDRHERVEPSSTSGILVDTSPGLGWYDLSVRIDGSEPFRRRYAGRVETGNWGYSDPAMGRVVDQLPRLNTAAAAK